MKSQAQLWRNQSPRAFVLIMEHFNQSIPSLLSQTLQEGGGYHRDEWIRTSAIIITTVSE